MLRSAYVSINFECVKTLDLRSPTGRPLAEVTPSRGFLRLLRRWEEKKSAPSDIDVVFVINGVERVGISVSTLVRGEEEDRDMMYSYISLSRSKSVGKKISKYPCLTRSLVQGTMAFRYLV